MGIQSLAVLVKPNIKMKILFLSRWFPYPTNNGSKLRIYNLLRELAQHHDVTLLSFADQPDANPDAPEIRSICLDVHIIPWNEFNPSSLRALSGFFSLTPRSLVDTFSLEMAHKIKHLISEHEFDLVIASQLSMAAYRLYYKDTPALFEEVEIGLSDGESQPGKNFKKRIRSALTWFKLRLYLSKLLGSFQVCTVVSEQERQLLLNSFSASIGMVEVIPNCVSVNEYNDFEAVLKPNQLIFSGSFRYHANYEAMLWFIREIYPQILVQVPDVQLIITGDHADLPIPPSPGVVLAGYVDDIKALIASSWISLAPLLSGGGTRLKILEAMAIGTPVVSTSKGAEGLNSTSGDHLLIADTPHAFANQVTKLLRSKTLRDQISLNGKKFVKEHYDWESVMPKFLRIVENTDKQST